MPIATHGDQREPRAARQQRRTRRQAEREAGVAARGGRCGLRRAATGFDGNR
jgi:hypothetical protein